MGYCAVMMNDWVMLGMIIGVAIALSAQSFYLKKTLLKLEQRVEELEDSMAKLQNALYVND